MQFRVSVCLNVGEYKIEIFQPREEEGFEGNGYDWSSLANVFLEEQIPELIIKAYIEVIGQAAGEIIDFA
ncbi:Imm51 family immunity protein [Sphingobacterium athyrii]|uniref:Uncharacterized protein n=1 Tax=Sphingobacterium athyrii TaxID=2152717 RepID=A0A363NUR9_9SPHI|nr:Imm51 family immunity protein [Sphingobacterium athyrii]PUV24565.1 hypothetical protein DCO56_14585 [Sphingobacterium athyrii]